MEAKSGSISISTENIFPIIKKWLYSEKDIFIREVVSNAGDAISKLKKLIAVGEAEIKDEQNWRIDVVLNKEEGTLKISDNGIGMTEEEVVKYINQVAFSGAKDFIEKYQGKTDGDQIIGHFGLGFYSTFMVSAKVEIDTLSWQEGAEAVHWESDTGMDFAISESDRKERGTTITLTLADDSAEYKDAFKVKEILNKYFCFLPVEIYFTEEGVEKEEKEENEDKKTEEKPINNTTPLWLKPVKDCTDEEYIAFYHEVFFDMNDPLFWIHLNIDYPFNLKGILYFPKIGNTYDALEGTIKVYYNQVFVADNVKEILPEFLMLLKGMIDCPDLPLNVSRSFLQNDGYVNKISQHITKKIADKLTGLFKTERENYEKYWDDINPFVKYGCLKDEKFYDKVKDVLIYKLTDESYVTAEEYAEKFKENAGEKIYYTDDKAQQAQYIKMFTDIGIIPAIMDGPIDTHFIQLLEYKNTGKIKFERIDAGVSDKMKSTDENAKIPEEEAKKILEKAKSVLQKYTGNEKLKIETEAINSDVPGIILLSEESRRMREMMKMYGNMGMPMEDDITFVLNEQNELVKKLANIEDQDKLNMLCEQIYDLAKLAHEPLSAEELTRFIERSGKILTESAYGC